MLLAEIRTRALASLMPPPRLRLSEWIERELRLPEGVSALPGPVRLWPYQVGIADAISDAAIERVTLVKPVRVGLSTMLASAIGHFVSNDPAPVLLVLPTESDCRDEMVQPWSRFCCHAGPAGRAERRMPKRASATPCSQTLLWR